MQWEQIVEWVKDFFNQPVPIISCTVGALLITILTIISKTSIGKKSIKRMLEAVSEVKLELTNTIAKTSDNVAQLKKEYETQLALAETHSQELEDLLLSISDQLHNAKIRELVEQYKSKRSEVKTAYENIIAQTNKALEEKKAELELQLKKFEEEFKKQRDEIMAQYQEIPVPVEIIEVQQNEAHE